MNKFEAESVIKNTIEYANQEIAKNKKKTRICITALIIGFSLVIAGILFWRPKSTIDIFVVGTAIGDISVEETKIINGEGYALLKNADLNNHDGITHYFNEPRWVKVSDHFDVDSIKVGEIYSSITLQVEIPKEAAINHEWISNDTLSLDMFLRDEAYNPDYVWVVDMWKE